MKRLVALVAALVACAVEAAPRVYSRECDVASRRSDRGGVYCSTPDGGSDPCTVAACTPGQTNSTLWSGDQTAGTPWTDQSDSAATPSRSAGPTTCGSATTRWQIPSTSTTAWSGRQQQSACPSGTVSLSLRLRGHAGAGSGSVNIVFYGSTAPGAYTLGAACAFTAVASRCSVPNKTITGVTRYVWIGNGIPGAVDSAHGATDVDIWDIQCEQGSSVTGPIPTAGTAVTCP